MVKTDNLCREIASKIMKIRRQDVPKVNGRRLSYGDIFNLYCGELGKPHNLICLYLCNQLIDIEALQWASSVNGKRLPGYLETIVRDYDNDISYEN